MAAAVGAAERARVDHDLVVLAGAHAAAGVGGQGAHSARDVLAREGAAVGSALAQLVVGAAELARRSRCRSDRSAGRTAARWGSRRSAASPSTDRCTARDRRWWRCSAGCRAHTGRRSGPRWRRTAPGSRSSPMFSKPVWSALQVCRKPPLQACCAGLARGRLAAVGALARVAQRGASRRSGSCRRSVSDSLQRCSCAPSQRNSSPLVAPRRQTGSSQKAFVGSSALHSAALSQGAPSVIERRCDRRGRPGSARRCTASGRPRTGRPGSPLGPDRPARRCRRARRCTPPDRTKPVRSSLHTCSTPVAVQWCWPTRADRRQAQRRARQRRRSPGCASHSAADAHSSATFQPVRPSEQNSSRAPSQRTSPTAHAGRRQLTTAAGLAGAWTCTMPSEPSDQAARAAAGQRLIAQLARDAGIERPPVLTVVPADFEHGRLIRFAAIAAPLARARRAPANTGAGRRCSARATGRWRTGPSPCGPRCTSAARRRRRSSRPSQQVAARQVAGLAWHERGGRAALHRDPARPSSAQVCSSAPSQRTSPASHTAQLGQPGSWRALRHRRARQIRPGDGRQGVLPVVAEQLRARHAPAQYEPNNPEVLLGQYPDSAVARHVDPVPDRNGSGGGSGAGSLICLLGPSKGTRGGLDRRTLESTSGRSRHGGVRVERHLSSGRQTQ